MEHVLELGHVRTAGYLGARFLAPVLVAAAAMVNPAAANPAQARPARSCAETPAVRATPPPANNAGPLDDGPWWVNADRTLWMQSATGPWHAGYNQKNMMVKPADVKPTLSGMRIDAAAPPMDVKWVPQLHAEFQTMALTFPTEGCWKLTATAGGHELSFVTVVR